MPYRKKKVRFRQKSEIGYNKNQDTQVSKGPSSEERNGGYYEKI